MCIYSYIALPYIYIYAFYVRRFEEKIVYKTHATLLHDPVTIRDQINYGYS